MTLAGVAGRLSAVTHIDAAIEIIRDGAVGVSGADLVDLGLLEDGGRIVTAAWAPAAEVTRRTLRIGVGDHLPAAEAIRRRSVVIVEDLPTYQRDHPNLLADARAAGVVSVASLPLLDADTHPVGVLSLAWRLRTPIDEHLRSVLETLAQLSGQTIGRTRLVGRLTQLSALTARLAAAPSATEVAALLADRGAALVDATYGSVRLVDESAGALVGVGPVRPPPHPAAEDDVIALGASLPIADAVRRGVPVWIATPQDYASQYPDVARDAVAMGVQAAVALPLHAADGARIGVISFAWDRPVHFDDRLRATASTIADVAGQTLARTRRYEAEHAAIAAMQCRLLGPPVRVGGLDIAVRYLPGNDALGMGGDWYDTVARPDGTLVLVMGDVAGHGVEALATMAQLRYLISGLVQTGTPLHRVFPELNRMLARDDGVYATAQMLHLDPVHQRLSYLSAGHPWALLRRPTGDVEVLDRAQIPPIGVADEPQPLAATDLPPGSVVLCYTDGLVERRERSIVERIERLAVLAAKADLDRPAQAILDQLVQDAMAPDEDGGPLDDDVAAVLVRT